MDDMRKTCLRSLSAGLFMCTLPIASSARNICDPLPPPPLTAVPMKTPACSYTALNPTCYIVLDRLHPLTPPTIYMRRNHLVYLVIYDASPFESVTLDLNSATAQVQPDQFYNGFTALTGALAGFQVTQFEAAAAASPHAAPPPPSASDILAQQNQILADMKQDFLAPAHPALDSIHTVLKPLPTDVCSLPVETKQAWTDTAAWVQSVERGLQAAVDHLGTSQFERRIAALDPPIESLAGDNTTSMSDVLKLQNNQKMLRAALKPLADAQDKLKAKLQALMGEVKEIQPTNPDVPAILSIADLHPSDRNDQLEVWNLNYTNKLAGVAKRVAGDTYLEPDPALLAGLADAPAKQAVVTLTAQFQSSSRLEVSSGFLVPVTPYHSYTAAQPYTASAPVVQENKTYTVVPDASFNILLGHELVKHSQRVAFFLTGAVGYTPATSSVAFGLGPSVSWRSIVFSPLADVGRDSELVGGYTVGGPLGTGTTAATAPQTKNFWDVKFAPGLSVRIPLGGASH
jgi:hypothetical protein